MGTERFANVLTPIRYFSLLSSFRFANPGATLTAPCFFNSSIAALFALGCFSAHHNAVPPLPWLVLSLIWAPNKQDRIVAIDTNEVALTELHASISRNTA